MISQSYSDRAAGVSVAMVLLPKPLIAGLVSVSARFQEPQRFGEWEDYIN